MLCVAVSLSGVVPAFLHRFISIRFPLLIPHNETNDTFLCIGYHRSSLPFVVFTVVWFFCWPLGGTVIDYRSCTYILLSVTMFNCVL
ncbi:hypothetical protein BDV98DRAFT_137149 [Pterulicium gracile]|uniref:Uncharacterized protein n=1 Tax=Pterulicium gracile TaxID=1884261 RepID=A0A5C3QZV4_9AGAR|nr:hypothetical protein BDV98DRAFT_137149 [Pterula gracilis]